MILARLAGPEQGSSRTLRGRGRGERGGGGEADYTQTIVHTEFAPHF